MISKKYQIVFRYLDILHYSRTFLFYHLFISKFYNSLLYPQFAKIINKEIQDLDPTIRVISEPGTYYVSGNFTLASYLHSKRVIPKDSKMVRMYYMNCGVFSAFLINMMGFLPKPPQLLSKVTSPYSTPIGALL